MNSIAPSFTDDVAEALTIEGLGLEIQGSRILSDIDLNLRSGEITALAGPNGAGKSSVVKSISGYYRAAQAASFRVVGRDIALPCDPRAVHNAGLRVVHQELGLIDEFSTFDNVMMGQIELSNATGVRRVAWSKDVQAIVDSLSGSFDVAVPVRELRPYERVIAAVARASYGGRTAEAMTVLVMDEVTAALPAEEIEVLLVRMRDVARSGVAVLFVTHHFDEIFESADSVVVIRDGRVSAHRRMNELTMRSLSELVFAGSAPEHPSAAQAEGRTAGSPLRAPRVGERCRVTALGVCGKRVQNVDLGLAPGQILGVTGRIGSGKSELGRIMAGQQKPLSGVVELNGVNLWSRDGASTRAGIGYVPQDRERQGVIPDMTLSENLHLGYRSATDGPGSLLWNDRRVQRADRVLLRENKVVPPKPHVLIKTLSGGNQQKIVFLRAVAAEPEVLVVDEPTIGVDLAARAHLHAMLRTRAAQGAAILMISSEAEEILEVADLVAVLDGGRMGDWMEPASLTVARLEAMVAAGNSTDKNDNE